MIHRIVRVLACAFLLPIVALAQSGSMAPPGAPSVGPDKIGIINMQSAILGTNDGQRDFQSLAKRFDPKKNDLKSLNDEIDGLKKQLETQGPTLNDEARASLGRQIDSKQKILSRSQEDAQNDYTDQQNEIVKKILQKLLPVIAKYAKASALSLVLDSSKPWPDSPVLWASPSVDITKPVVDNYNAERPPQKTSPALQTPEPPK
jgi:outer membrane protein